MSFFEAQSWQLPMRQQASWDEPPPLSRSGMVDHTVVKSDQVLTRSKGASSAVQRDENFAFDTQIEGVSEVRDRVNKLLILRQRSTALLTT